jgi:hypothetical protein
VESKRTIWEYEDATYQIHNAVVAIADDEGSADTHTDRQACTPSLVALSSVGGRTFHSTSETCGNTPPSELRQTREQYYAGSQNTPPTIDIQVQAETRLASIESQPSHPLSEADAQIVTEDMASNEAVPNEMTAVSHSSDHDDTLNPTEPAAGNIPVTPSNEPANIVGRQASASSCDGPGRDGKEEPDYGRIVRDLQQLKAKRKIQEHKIEAGHNSLPDVSTLTQSASDSQRAAEEAQRAADEVQRIADEARHAAETAKKAVEDAEAKQSQLAADRLYLEKLTEDSICLRAKLNID